MTAAVGILPLVVILLWPCPLAAAPVAVRFTVHEKSRDVFILKVFLLGS